MKAGIITCETELMREKLSIQPRSCQQETLLVPGEILPILILVKSITWFYAIKCAVLKLGKAVYTIMDTWSTLYYNVWKSSQMKFWGNCQTNREISQSNLITGPHLQASQDLQTTATNLRAKTSLFRRQQLFTGLNAAGILGNFHPNPFYSTSCSTVLCLASLCTWMLDLSVL